MGLDGDATVSGSVGADRIFRAVSRRLQLCDQITTSSFCKSCGNSSAPRASKDCATADFLSSPSFPIEKV